MKKEQKSSFSVKFIYKNNNVTKKENKRRICQLLDIIRKMAD